MGFEIPALGMTTFGSDGQEGTRVGSAVVASERRLGGVVRSDISGIGIAGVGSSEPLDGFITPVRRQLEGINTGVAIHNTESQTVTLNLTLRDKQGTLLLNGTKTIEDFSAGGQLAQFIGGGGEVLFPDADGHQRFRGNTGGGSYGWRGGSDGPGAWQSAGSIYDLASNSPAVAVSIVENWFEELQRLVSNGGVK